MKKIFINLFIWIILFFSIIQIYPDGQKDSNKNITDNNNVGSESRKYFMGFNINWQKNMNLYKKQFQEAIEYSDIIMSVYNPSWEKLKNPNNSFYKSQSNNKSGK